MDKILVELRQRGCDVDVAMERFIGDRDLYLQCYQQMMEAAEFERLKQLAEEGDSKGCFKVAHGLKGVLSNMGLIPLSGMVSKIVEKVRDGSCEEVLPECLELLAMRDSYASLLNGRIGE